MFLYLYIKQLVLKTELFELFMTNVIRLTQSNAKISSEIQ